VAALFSLVVGLVDQNYSDNGSRA